MRRLLKSVALVAVTLTSIGLWAYPARATTEVTFITSDDIFHSDADCGFDIAFRMYGTFKVVDTFDAAGTLRIEHVLAGGGRFNLSATANGITITAVVPQNFGFTTRFNPDGSISSVMITGNFVHFTVPGYGNVLVQIGLIVLGPDSTPVFQAGPNQDLGGGDKTAFCSLFTP